MLIEFDKVSELWIAYVGSESGRRSTCYGSTYENLIKQVEAYYLSPW